MKVVYFLISDKSKSFFEYTEKVLFNWVIPSIKQCIYLNPKCEIHIITDINNLNLYFLTTEIFIHKIEDYHSNDIDWFNTNYIHLSPNYYQFEKNAIMRVFYLRNFCNKNKIESFLHIELDVLVYSNILEDSEFFKSKYDMTLIHKLGAGVNFINNGINILNKICDCIINSYSNPQKEPKAFDMLQQQEYRKNNVGGVSDMNFWQWYGLTHDKVFMDMDQDINGIFYQTYIHSPENSGIYTLDNWECVIDQSINTKVKKINIIGNECFATYKNKKIKIKYLHFHGNRKSIISSYIIKT
jgi:hypothetical protein